MPSEFHIFANAALGKGLSGSDRIFIEFSKRLSKKFQVSIHVWSEGYKMCLRQNLKKGRNIYFQIINADILCNLGFIVCYISRIILGLKEAFKLQLSNQKYTIIYSASEFWMDSLPALILKLRFSRITWVASWFQTAPNPFQGFTQGNRKTTYKLSALCYWLMQLPIKPLIEKFADVVLVNNEIEKERFLTLNKNGRAIVILGAVNLEEIEIWTRLHGGENLPKAYDAVFQGRFHPQKGVVELIEIWKLVTQSLPNARLVMIGDGPLMSDVKLKIKQLGLEDNVKLLGYVFDGPKKYKTFAQSKIVVHPSFFDSGGMAAAEAMAFSLPAVGFNLDSYKSYYPKGMIKVPVGDLEGFADKIIELVANEGELERIGAEAQKMVSENWSWDQRANQFLDVLKNIN